MRRLIAALVISAAFAGTFAGAEARSVVSKGVDVDPVDMLVVEAMKREYEVSAEVAYLRALEQPSFEKLNDELQAKFGNDGWGGAWIDHETDGQLNVAIVDPALANVITASVPAELEGRVKVVQVTHDISRLYEATDAVTELQATNPEITWIAPFYPTNSVQVVTTGSTAESSALVEEVVRRAGNVPVQFEFGSGEMMLASCFTHLQVCDPAPVGGIEITEAGNPTHNCTFGFAVRSNVSGTVYGMTAGHCVVAGYSAWYIAGNPSYTNYSIGNPQLYYNDGGGATRRDFALLRFDATPAPSNTRVLVQASSGGTPTTLNISYPISATGEMITNGYYCKTGQFTGTECSRKVSRTYNVDRLYNPEVAAVVCVGDSGGPVYKNNTAYGIIHALDNGGTENRLTYFHGTVSRPCAGSTNHWYAYRMNIALGYTNSSVMP